MINKRMPINMLGNVGVPFWHVDTLQIRQESRHPSLTLSLHLFSLSSFNYVRRTKST